MISNGKRKSLIRKISLSYGLFIGIIVIIVMSCLIALTNYERFKNNNDIVIQGMKNMLFADIYQKDFLKWELDSSNDDAKKNIEMANLQAEKIKGFYLEKAKEISDILNEYSVLNQEVKSLVDQQKSLKSSLDKTGEDTDNVITRMNQQLEVQYLSLLEESGKTEEIRSKTSLMQLSNEIHQKFLKNRVLEKEYLRTYDEVYIEQINNKMTDIKSKAQELKEQSVTNMNKAQSESILYFLEQYETDINTLLEVNSSLVEKELIMNRLSQQIIETSDGVISQQQEELTNINKAFLFTIILLLITALFVSFITTRRIRKLINKPIEIIKNDLGEAIENKDLTRSISVNSGDEFSLISEYINTFISELHQIVIEIFKSSKAVGNSAKSVDELISKMGGQIEMIGEFTNQLSESTNETEELSKEIDEETGNIHEVVTQVKSTTDGIIDSLEENNKQAKILQSDAQNVNETTKVTYLEVKDHMNESLEQVSAVSEIKNLSESIIVISKETKLLALNAAIEAARAGDIGLGFGVVAESIRKLSENTEDAIHKIQEISEKIVSVVDNLAQNANELIKIVDNNINNNYEMLDIIGKKYLDDLTNFKKMFSVYHNQMESVSNMTDKIHELSNSQYSIVKENHDKTINIVESVELLQLDSRKIIEEIDQFNFNSEKLDNLAKGFII